MCFFLSKFLHIFTYIFTYFLRTFLRTFFVLFYVLFLRTFLRKNLLKGHVTHKKPTIWNVTCSKTHPVMYNKNFIFTYFFTYP